MRYCPAGGCGSISRAWMEAVAMMLSVPAAQCLVLAANGSTIQAAAGAGMVAVAVPRRLAAAATFPGAKAKFEGYGPGLCTWKRLASLA